MFYEQSTLNCNGFLLDLSAPVVMGIINATPDSFFAGSRATAEKEVLTQAEKMLTEGATFLDIGGMSTRPNAPMVTENEETARVLPVIQLVKKHFPDALISVDTFRSSVAKAAVTEGACVVNDISAGRFDPAMFETVAALRNVPYILMHIKSDSPETMHQKTSDGDDIALEVLDFFIERLGILRGLGVKDIILDAGFGFGKTLPQNFNLLKKMHVFKMLDVPILAGLSRKSMIWRTLGISADEALNGTTVCNVVALQQGAKILRVHDVKEAMQAIQLVKFMN